MAKYHKFDTYSILVKGRVQGIGFRPFVYRQAQKLKLKGLVKNTKQGVLIQCQGKNVQKLIGVLKFTPPPLSRISEMSVKKIQRIPFKVFAIQKSIENGIQSELVQIMPDLAVCPDCIQNIEDKKNRRFYYPFTNCTQCGPRYSIIYNLPYDRPRTTMRTFKMCKDCEQEYNNPLDRRFHAQPNACPICGPWLALTNTKGNVIKTKNDKDTINKTQNLLFCGNIVAIRSIGGFLLACDAKSAVAVSKLRKRKDRPAKPFAIMCKDVQTIRRLCEVNNEEIRLLKSQIAPIVLLKKRKNRVVSDWIAPKNGYLGVMLPYTPLHKMLFNVSRETLNKRSKGKSQKVSLEALVMTSANPKGAPIIANSSQLIKKLGGVIDYILDHNRPIESRCDDSVVFNYKGPVIVRYSRGYVPEPLLLNNINLKPVLAFGSDLKNSFALGQGNKLYLSPYIGDLISGDSMNFLFEMLEKYQKWFAIKPEVVACDLHPDYISARLAEEYTKRYRLKLTKVQHHYAHLAGVMAEHGIAGPVIGVGYDGTGYGTDGAVWGSEMVVLDYSGFERIAHLKYLPLVGGDVAVTNPGLIAKAYLQEHKVNPSEKNVPTSSMARLFDAAASILGLCQHQSFEGEAPIALEGEAMNGSRRMRGQGQRTENRVDSYIIDPVQILEEIIDLKKKNVSVPEIALYFHNQIITTTINIVKQTSKAKNINTVCLSGGVFQNRILLHGIDSGLSRAGFKVFINRRVPINDGGIAFGQAIIAGQIKK